MYYSDFKWVFAFSSCNFRWCSGSKGGKGFKVQSKVTDVWKSKLYKCNVLNCLEIINNMCGENAVKNVAKSKVKTYGKLLLFMVITYMVNVGYMW